MTLGLNSSLSTAVPTVKPPTISHQPLLHSPHPSSSTTIATYPMANVAGQPEEDATPKDSFDHTPLRTNSSFQAPHQPSAPISKLSANFQPQDSLPPHHPGASPAHIVQSAQMVPPPIIPHPTPISNPVGVQYPQPIERHKEPLQPYDLFPDINVQGIVTPNQDPTPQSNFSIDPKAPQTPQHVIPGQPSSANLYDHRKQNDNLFYPLPVAGGPAGRVAKRVNSRPDMHDNSPSPSVQSPTPRTMSTPQSSLERRKAHRAYTQKSRNKVNSRFEALLDALPTPPPRLNPRSKAEILEYATETVIHLVSQNNKLELHLALSSSPQLEAWLTDQTQSARTVREVCQPIMRLFTIGLEWKGAEVWAIDSRAPTSTASLGQAWTFVPPPSGRGPSREEEAKISELGGFLDSGKGNFYALTSNEALAVVYRSGKPAWLSCEFKAQLGFEDQEFTTERTRMAQNYGISDVLFVPLILYNHVQIVVTFYNMRSRSASGNPGLQPQIDPKSSIKVATEAIGIIARRFCSLPGVSEFAEQG